MSGVLGKHHRLSVFISHRCALPRAVLGHHDHPRGREWMKITDHVNPILAELLGRENVPVAFCGFSTHRSASAKVPTRLRLPAWGH